MNNHLLIAFKVIVGAVRAVREAQPQMKSSDKQSEPEGDCGSGVDDTKRKRENYLEIICPLAQFPSTQDSQNIYKALLALHSFVGLPQAVCLITYLRF